MVALCCYERPRGVVRNSYSSFFIPNYTKICAIFGDITLCSYFCTMRKWIYILLLGFCLYFGQEQVVVCHSTTEVCEQELSSRYQEQLENQQRHNNFATRTETISVSTSSSTSSASRAQVRAISVGVIHTAAARAVYLVQQTLNCKCSRRIVDYYLYTLCCLRL